MQRPNSQSITLGDILITAELSHRVSRAPNLQAENQAMRALIHQMAQDSEILMQTLVDKALELCEAGTAGLSLLETTPEQEEIFRWNALAGTLAHQVGGSTPRNFSPCGVCLDQGSPVLFSHPERYFTYFQGANTPIVEGLVLPLVADRHIFGTIWIVSHDEQRQFDSEDVRIMTSLADLTTTALLLQQRQTRELLAANAALEAEIAERKQTEAQLSKAQRRLELSLEGANLGTWTYRVDTDEFWADDRALHLHGHAPGEVHTFADAGVNIHPVDREQTQVALAQALQTHSKVQVEYRVIWPDGSVHWIASYAEFMPLDEDEGMFYGIVLDITERKQSEAAIAADLQDTQLLHNFATRLTTEGDIETLYQEIVVAAIALTRADAGSIQVLDETTQELVLIATQGPTPEMIEHFHRVNAGSNTSCGRALVTGERTFVDFDVPQSEDPDGSLRMHVEAGYLSAQSTPLITRSGKPIGMVSTHWREHHRPSERELRFLDLLARQAADLIEQRQAQVVLHESEARLQSIANLVPDLLWDSEPDGSTNWYNQRWIEYTGQTFEQAIGWGWIDAIHPDDREESARRYREAVEQGMPLQQEHRIRRHDGEYHWFVVNAFPLKDESGKVVKMYGAATDIHEACISLAALQESEAKYRSLFELINDAFARLEVLYDDDRQPIDCRFLEVSPSFEAHTTLPQAQGKTLRELIPSVESGWFEHYHQALVTNAPVHFEMYQSHIKIWFKVDVLPYGNPQDRQVVIVFQNINERKRTEEQQAFLLRLSDALRVEPDADSIASRAVQMLAEHLCLDRVWLSEVFEQQGVSTVGPEYHRTDLPPMSGVYRLSDYPETMQQLMTQPMVIHDVANDPVFSATEKALLNQLHLRALLVVALRKGQHQVIWAMAAAMTTPRHWNESEQVLLEQVSERTWVAIERARAEAALRESEARYRSLFNSMDEGVSTLEVIFDENERAVDFIYLENNQALTRLTGLTSEINGKRVSEVLPNLETFWFEMYGRVIQTGTPERVEHFIAVLDRWFDVFAARVGGADSHTVVVLYNDITDRKRTEEQQAFLLKFSDALRAKPDADAVANCAIQMLIEQLQLDRSYITSYYLEDNRADLNYQIGNDSVPPLPDHFVLSNFPEALKATFEGTLVIEDDWERQGLSEAEKRNSHNLGMRAMVAATLRKENHPLWSMVAMSSRPRRWMSAEIALVEEVAERTWVAIERTRAEVALRESELQRVREQAAREQERQRAESLAELDRAKTLFFSNVSHEFRTPLTLSLAPLQDALSDRTHPLDPIHQERLELVHRNSLRLLKLVNTLLDFSRIEAGRMEAVYEPTALAQFTTDLASVFRSAIERAGLQLIVDCPPLPEPVYVDRDMWEKIVLNLLSNALKFTFEGEIRVWLYLGTGEMGSKGDGEQGGWETAPQAILEICDTGAGIAPEHLPHLFERFYQVRGTQARTDEGSGIGLALVHELVHLHGGTIEVSSTLGEGTCFTVSLPFGTEHLPYDRLQYEGDRQPVRTLASTAMGAASYVKEAEQWLPTGDFGSPILDCEFESTDAVSPDLDSDEPTHYSKSKILLVDDNADMREYLTRILSQYVQVTAVADGATALALAKERVPDLILSDVMIPGLNGFELMEALRADPRTGEVPIILLSARAGEEAIVEGLAAGADDYWIKPFSAQELISRVMAHLQMAQLRGAALQQERTMNRHKDEFISVISHELNTPLASILGWTRMLQSGPFNPAMLSKALDMIERNATLQGNLVQDLLDLSRITAGKLRLNLQPIELKSIIETAIATVTQTAVNQGIHLTWQENVTEPIVVMGDGDRLGQVLANLLMNAIKFTPESGRVEVGLSLVIGHWSLAEEKRLSPNDKGRMTKDHYAEIRVTDTGIGIAANFLPHVFDRFRQAEGTHATKGLGLGLAIARHIVELHNGFIRAESPGEGQGTTLIVALPLTQ